MNARGGPTRKGVYSIDLTVTPAQNIADIIYSHTIEFDSVLDADPFSGATTLYYQYRGANADPYLPTNDKLNFKNAETADNDDFNASQYPSGQYEVCADVVSQASGGFNQEAVKCENIVVSSGPTLAIATPPSQGPAALSPTPAGAQWFGAGEPRPDASISPPPALNPAPVAVFDLKDVVGLQHFALYADPAFSREIYAAPLNGVKDSQQPVDIPADQPGYAAVVTNVLGQAATGFFNYDATPPMGIYKEGA